LDASGGGASRNLLGAAEGALIRAAASTQPLGASWFWQNEFTNQRIRNDFEKTSSQLLCDFDFGCAFVGAGILANAELACDYAGTARNGFR